MWRSPTGFPWRDTWQRPWQKAEEEKKTKTLLLTEFHDNIKYPNKCFQFQMQNPNYLYEKKKT